MPPKIPPVSVSTGLKTCVGTIKKAEPVKALPMWLSLSAALLLLMRNLEIVAKNIILRLCGGYSDGY